MKVKAQPLGDASPLAIKHTPPQGKAKKVVVKDTKGKEKDIIGTSGHSPLPGIQPRNVVSKFARSRDAQQVSVSELRKKAKTTAKNPPKGKGVIEEKVVTEESEEGLFAPYVREEESVGVQEGGSMDEEPAPSVDEAFCSVEEEPHQPDAEATESDEKPTHAMVAIPSTRRRRDAGMQISKELPVELVDDNAGDFLEENDWLLMGE